MNEIKNNLQFKDDKLHLEDEVVMKKVSGIPVNQEDETGTIDVDANINIGGSANINGDVTVKGSVTIEGTSYKVIESPEYVWAIVDNDDKILCGIKTNGKFVADIDGIDEKLQEAINQMQTIIDEAQASIDEKIASIDEKFDFISWIGDLESRSEITTDAEGKILSYRDADGVKHEEVGIETNHLGLSFNATQDLINALDALGYTANNPADWSDSEFVEIPIPSVCAVVNIETDGQAEAKGVDIPTHIQFWDKSGNYFRKPIELNAQGSSSMSYHIKNQAIDFTDGSKIKFGNWPAFDSFHIKKYFIDVFRGQCIVGYWLTEQVYQTRPYAERRPWDYLNKHDSIRESNDRFAKDFDSGALAHPDGFPVHVFFNGTDAGIYAFNIKKDRSNYYAKKTNQKNIILDGVLGNTFFTANGDMSITGDEGGNLWHDFEVRNPKISTDIDGNKYDGDNPTEPSNDYATTKAAIARLTTAISATLAESTDEAKKAKFEEFFNLPFLIDYDLIGQVIFHDDGYRKNWIWCSWDGNLWCPTSYDMDSIFGASWNGCWYINNSESNILGTSQAGNEIPTDTLLLKTLYSTELKARYKELRDKGVFSVDNIVGLLEKWVNKCGYDNLKHDIEDIVTSPYIENGEIVIDGEGNPVLVPNTPSYRDVNKTYVYPPTGSGWYNSLQRIKNWLIVRLANLDIYYDYNQN